MNHYLIGTLTNLHTLRVQGTQTLNNDDELKTHCAEKYGTTKWTRMATGALQGWVDNLPRVVVVSRPMPSLLKSQAV